MRGQLCISPIFFFSLPFSMGGAAAPPGGKQYAGTCSKVATQSPKLCVVGSIPNCPCHRRDLLPRSRTERKPAEVVFPVRCTKAAGRRNLFIGWHRLCKDERMRPTYRRRAVKFRGWSGYHHAERNPRRGCGVVTVVLGQSCCVGQYGCVVVPD